MSQNVIQKPELQHALQRAAQVRSGVSMLSAFPLAMAGYLVLAEGLLLGLFPRLTPWLLSINIDAFVRHGTEWVEWPQTCDDVTVMCREIVHEVSFTQGALVLLGVLLVVVREVHVVALSQRPRMLREMIWRCTSLEPP